MKPFLPVFALLLCSGFAFCQTTSQPGPSDLKKLNWLAGGWTRTNTKPGRSGHERWTRLNDAEWEGLGIALHGRDTTFVEILKIVLKDGSICYVADLVENKQPTYFKFTEITDHGFVCENPQHDFPKKISYQKTGDTTLKATISGDGRFVDYFFEKQK
jgi:Domain of unknown function (DUF6265)